jgi:hypothetical protein
MSTTTQTINDPDVARANETAAFLSQVLPKEKPRGPGRPKKVQVLDEGKSVMSLDSQQSIWISAVTAAMTTLQIRTAKEVERCLPIADAVLEEFNKRWK